MSVRIAAAVFESTVGPATKRLVLLALADSANDEGVCWPAVATIAGNAGASVSTVRKCLTELEADGLILRQHRVNNSNMYRIVLSKLLGGPKWRAIKAAKEEAVDDESGDPDPSEYETPPESGPLSDPDPSDFETSGSETPPLRDSEVTPPESGPKPSVEPSKNRKRSTSRRKEPPRPDVDALCQRLYDRVVANESKAEITETWRKEARLLLDADGRDFEKALNLIDWCQKSTFWRRNVRSMPKFREQYDALRLEALDEYEKAQGRHLRVVDPTTGRTVEAPSRRPTLRDPKSGMAVER